MKIIYLQVDQTEVTWCQDKINDSDVEYIRKDIYDSLKEENERLKKVLLNSLELLNDTDQIDPNTGELKEGQDGF